MLEIITKFLKHKARNLTTNIKEMDYKRERAKLYIRNQIPEVNLFKSEAQRAKIKEMAHQVVLKG